MRRRRAGPDPENGGGHGTRGGAGDATDDGKRLGRRPGHAQVGRGGVRSPVEVRVNRLQALVLGFFLLAWAGVVALLVAAPAVVARALRLPPGAEGGPLAAGFLGGLAAFLVPLGVGVVRRWRWAFWLVKVAFLAGALRAPVAVLEVAGRLPAAAPGWYAGLQG